ncbi:hypothetical protein L208DRAFT_1558823 [Tricholoma matsutake]|nr:hypothetical protein L208DRAFT_1558823 [Tricholoma matsutake 945]
MNLCSPIALFKITERSNHSLTTSGSESNFSTFRSHITRRDVACVVTRSIQSLVASHLIPKRMGSDGPRVVVTRFVGTASIEIRGLGFCFSVDHH